MIWPLLAILTVILLLLLSAPLLKGGAYSKPVMSLFFIGFIALSLGTYAMIGRPDLLQEGALKPYAPPPGPTAEQVQAAQEMSPEDRAEMILAMVDSLATKLEDNPADPQGWARLLRARTVLGQTEKLEADKSRVKDIFKDDPQTLSLILGEFD
jgi:cytochrome c-type biogenesis protein CcmH/NrfG